MTKSWCFRIQREFFSPIVVQQKKLFCFALFPFLCWVGVICCLQRSSTREGMEESSGALHFSCCLLIIHCSSVFLPFTLGFKHGEDFYSPWRLLVQQKLSEPGSWCRGPVLRSGLNDSHGFFWSGKRSVWLKSLPPTVDTEGKCVRTKFLSFT